MTIPAAFRHCGQMMPAHSLFLTVNAMDAQRGGRIVAQGVSFSLGPGDAITLRGQNGTGKTSILRAIAGFSAAPHGTIDFRHNGAPADPAEMRATQIHWLGGGDGIADRLTVEENLHSWAGLLTAPTPKPAEILQEVGLGALATRPAGKLSTGQRRRLGLSRLLIAPRALWLLDEPLNGLDDMGRELLLKAAAAHRALGGLVLMASHEDGLPEAPVLRLAPEVPA